MYYELRKRGTAADIPSVVERTRVLKFDAPVVSAHFLADRPVFVLGEEAAMAVEPESEPRRIIIHSGAILSSAADGKRLLTGGDDGKVAVTGPDFASAAIFEDEKHRWIDHVACGPQ